VTGRRRRGGFTFIEVLTVMIVMGILATLAILRYIDLRDRATASGMASELNGIRLAAYNYWADHDQWPAESAPGVVPAGLAPYLPRNFSFARPRYTIDWENFVPADGSAGGGNGVMQVGLTVTSSSTGLIHALVLTAAGGAPFFVVGNTLTYVILEPNGSM
jgi:prepilin-type N-terminal cleavage/methylation domain-containing protein